MSFNKIETRLILTEGSKISKEFIKDYKEILEPIFNSYIEIFGRCLPCRSWNSETTSYLVLKIYHPDGRDEIQIEEIAGVF